MLKAPQPEWDTRPFPPAAGTGGAGGTEGTEGAPEGGQYLLDALLQPGIGAAAGPAPHGRHPA